VLSALGGSENIRSYQGNTHIKKVSEAKSGAVPVDTSSLLRGSKEGHQQYRRKASEKGSDLVRRRKSTLEGIG